MVTVSIGGRKCFCSRREAPLEESGVSVSRRHQLRRAWCFWVVSVGLEHGFSYLFVLLTVRSTDSQPLFLPEGSWYVTLFSLVHFRCIRRAIITSVISRNILPEQRYALSLFLHQGLSHPALNTWTFCSHLGNFGTDSCMTADEKHQIRRGSLPIQSDCDREPSLWHC